MSLRETVVLICDLCSTEDPDNDVQTHTLIVDGSPVEAEACKKCWHKVLAATVTFRGAGRVPKSTPRMQVVQVVQAAPEDAEAVPWPGETWRFTFHALLRMGERRIEPLAVIQAVEDRSAIVHPGRTPESEVRIAGNLKITIDPKKRRIITTAWREEEAATA